MKMAAAQGQAWNLCYSKICVVHAGLCTCGASWEAICPCRKGCFLWTPPWQAPSLFPLLFVHVQLLCLKRGQPGSLRLTLILKKNGRKGRSPKNKVRERERERRRKTWPKGKSDRRKKEQENIIHQPLNTFFKTPALKTERKHPATTPRVPKHIQTAERPPGNRKQTYTIWKEHSRHMVDKEKEGAK